MHFLLKNVQILLKCALIPLLGFLDGLEDDEDE